MRWLNILGGVVFLAISSCNLLKEISPLTVYGIFGEIGPATGPVEQFLGIQIPTDGLDPEVQTAVVYVADEKGTVSDAQVSLDGQDLPFQDSVNLYFLPVQDSVPIPAPVNIQFGSSRLWIQRGDRIVELVVPEGASLESLTVQPDTVRAGQDFVVALTFSGQADSIRLELSGGGVSFDTTLIPQTGSLSVRIPGEITQDFSQETVLRLSTMAFSATTGGDGVTPVSLQMVVRSKVVAFPVMP